MTEAFTTKEQTGPVKDSLTLLWRYVLGLKGFVWLAALSTLCSIVGAASYQGFIWLTGLYVKCPDLLSCKVDLPQINYTINVTLLNLVIASIVIVCVRTFGWILFEVGGQWSALSLHALMVRGLGHVRTTFFDEFPSGKLINRVVRDFDQLRIMGPIRIGDTMNALVEVFIITAMVCVAQPVAGLVVLPTLGAFYYIQRNVAPMLQRCLTLRSVQFGEMLHRETDVMEGIRTFLMYDQTEALFERLRSAVRGYSSMHVLRFQVEGWGRFWSQSAAVLYAAIALMCVAVGLHHGQLSMVTAGVILTAVFRLGGSFGWLSWAAGLLFESAAHARRVFEYTDLPSEEKEEGTPEISDNSAPQGAIRFENYTMSYRKTTPVILSKFNLEIPPGSKVGIIGRTGAGKTSMVQSLFRMVYVHGGDIKFGSKSLFSLPVEEARTFFAVVPQDPYLFEGTVLSNIDRYKEHPQEKLKQVLSTFAPSMNLDQPVHEGGKNLSAGERQLLCLARTMLSKRPVVIMDEPTSGVDTITDAQIQRILATALKDRTIITVAHRLETLSRMDRIIELSDGKIVRDGRPEEIISVITEEELE